MSRLASRAAKGAPASSALTSSTAVIMPIYNEDTARVFAGLTASFRSAKETGHGAAFHFFLLSDTTNATIAACEERAFARFVHDEDAAGSVFYRRRTSNEGKKAGNIAEFLRRFGLRYDHMIVLDADSVMSGTRMVELVRAMEADPNLGIVQTVPLPVGRDTLFARALQFLSRLNGPTLACGLDYWQRDCGNYWGHNAILRTRAFIAHCGLPKLPARPPFGGDILSHDFVEAALMLRAGYKVKMLPTVGGSYEEVPANVLDYATRDRRWCQGNLQHLVVLPATGLRPLSRFHLVCGVMAYVSSPLWLTLLALSTLDVVEQARRGHAYFAPGKSLFPAWPISKSEEIVSLFALTMAMLLLPQLYGLALALFDRAERRGFGGAWPLVKSALGCIVFAMLLAPPMMLFHSRFVVQTLLGGAVGWSTQPRSDRGVSLGEALERHRFHLVTGLVWGSLVLAVSPRYFLWFLPVLAGLVLSVAFTVWTSRADVGRAARARGWFVTPEESAPPRELAVLASLMSAPGDDDREIAAPSTWTPPPSPCGMRPAELYRRGPARPWLDVEASVPSEVSGPHPRR